jgi:hypothetical protein
MRHTGVGIPIKRAAAVSRELLTEVTFYTASDILYPPGVSIRLRAYSSPLESVYLIRAEFSLMVIPRSRSALARRQEAE